MITTWFQSTRPRGARLTSTLSRTAWCSFNPRARAGRDIAISGGAEIVLVSIHAPARGATYIFWQPALYGPEFQSTRPRGARLEAAMSLPNVYWFQSTRPRGARQRSRVQGRRSTPFQSTRPRGARPARHRSRFIFCCFNPRARAGRDSN